MTPRTSEQVDLEPVRSSVSVEAPIEHAFVVFTNRIGDWWPKQTHSVHEEAATSVGMETRAGGAIFETFPGGREVWGEIITWEPPSRLVFTWHPGYSQEEATEVEVRFAQQGETTVVELEHRGWEARGSQAREIRASYQTGWVMTLDRYAATATA